MGYTLDDNGGVSCHYSRCSKFRNFVSSCKSSIALQTMPLMNVILGRLVNGFNSYSTPGAQPTVASFNKLLNRQSLYIFILFLARFFLNYVSKFSFRLIGIRMSAKIR